jgi:hypothetical protein
VAAAEIALGIMTLIPATARIALRAALVLLPLLLVGGMVSGPAWLVTPFNAPTLVAAMLALAIIGLSQEEGRGA